GYSPTTATREMHYNRNQRNKDISYEDATAKWKKSTPFESTYHRMGPDNKLNEKYVSSDGHHEAVFHPDRSHVTNSANMATYNFHPQWERVPHFLNDVVPYWVWGNTPDDPTWWWERMFGTYEDESPCE
ncbi:MAG: hypothetical protein U9Q67_03595, partial [Patescibacteria group bacterium]|nr:hypothetical protein [Patescibacteria group bacterium]